MLFDNSTKWIYMGDSDWRKWPGTKNKPIISFYEKYKIVWNIYLENIDGIFSGAQLALEDTAGLTASSLERVRLEEGNVLPVVGDIAAIAAPQLQVPPEVFPFGLESRAGLHLCLHLKSNLHHYSGCKGFCMKVNVCPCATRGETRFYLDISKCNKNSKKSDEKVWSNAGFNTMHHAQIILCFGLAYKLGQELHCGLLRLRPFSIGLFSKHRHHKNFEHNFKQSFAKITYKPFWLVSKPCKVAITFRPGVY